ncbi:helix-turn-helix domain-containing protein [Neisseria sicca]|uniref:helix-turn-helix domain-containing protein n=1 Tax=Neisseria sicca TaxID=490 RepID=UPI0021BE0C11|nr:helix-turn-helix domain-containing protein [Neisseria sicca]
MKEQHLQQEQAAQIFNTTPPPLSHFLNPKITNFTIHPLLTILPNTPKTPQLNITP